MGKRIRLGSLPQKALEQISARQQSYLDEFAFYRLDDGAIEAWYGGECLATWRGKSWTER